MMMQNRLISLLIRRQTRAVMAKRSLAVPPFILSALCRSHHHPSFPAVTAAFNRPFFFSSDAITAPIRFFSSSSSSSAHQSAEKSAAARNNDDDDWTLVFRFQEMAILQAISRLKWLLTLATLVQPVLRLTSSSVSSSPPSDFSSASSSLSSSLVSLIDDPSNPLLIMCLLSLSGLSLFSIYAQRIAANIYVNQRETHVKFKHISFWGNRAETVWSVDDVISPFDVESAPEKLYLLRILQFQQSESEDREQSSTQKQKKTKQQKKQQMFYLPYRFGRVVNQEKFFVVFGPVL